MTAVAAKDPAGYRSPASSGLLLYRHRVLTAGTSKHPLLLLYTTTAACAIWCYLGPLQPKMCWGEPQGRTQTTRSSVSELLLQPVYGTYDQAVLGYSIREQTS